MRELFGKFYRDEKGQDMIEYALLAAFIALVAYSAVQAVGTQVTTIFSNVSSTLAGGGTGS